MEGRKLLSRRDLLVFGLIILLAAGVFLLLRQGGGGVLAVVEVDGETVARRELAGLGGPETLTLTGAGGVELVVEFTPDGARVASSTCPDQTCVRTGTLTHAGESAICLPGRVVVRLEAPQGDDSAPDAQTY